MTGNQEESVKMEQQQLLDEIIANPVIAAVRSESALDLALAGPVRTVFLLSGSINGLAGQCRRITESGRLCFLHVDLIEGLRPDQAGLRYLADQIRPTGIITTKPNCVRWAQSAGLHTVQRIFLLDSAALQDGMRHVQACQPDLVEVLPGIAEKAIHLACQSFGRPLIAGGLIRSREEIFAALAAGALGVSTGSPELWQL
jgi:glycerol uptake operon antiterminator